MNKNVEQHLDELIEYYRDTSIDDAGYLKKLFVRNLGDVKRRYVKYDKPKFDNLEKQNKQLKYSWNKLKEKIIDSFNKTQDVQFLDVLQDMQELEQGSDSNE